MNRDEIDRDSLKHDTNLFYGLPLINSEGEKKLLEFCDRNRISVLSTMSFIASEIAGNCGFNTLFYLIHNCGGRKIYFPKDFSRFNEIYGVNIPCSIYEKIIYQIDVSRGIDLPSAWGVFMSIRRAAIQIALNEKMPFSEVAKNFGISVRGVRMFRPPVK